MNEFLTKSFESIEQYCEGSSRDEFETISSTLEILAEIDMMRSPITGNDFETMLNLAWCYRAKDDCLAMPRASKEHWEWCRKYELSILGLLSRGWKPTHFKKHNYPHWLIWCHEENAIDIMLENIEALEASDKKLRAETFVNLMHRI